MKVLFLVPYPTDGASNRMRVEQFLPYLESSGIKCKVRPFMNRRFFKIIYSRRGFVEKMMWFFISTVNRLLDIARAVFYDVIFIHREAYPFGGPYFEEIFHAMGKPIVFDFDDAIFLPNTSKQNIYIERLKKPEKTSRIISISRTVIAGNEYLRNYAMKYNKNVVVIPTSIDTDRYRPPSFKGPKSTVVIGWLGSNTTKDFLHDIEVVFERLSARFANLTFKIVGAELHNRKLNNIINRKWSLESEIDALKTFDIGIMPMPDNEWTRGKCAFKAILYMSLGIPAVCSPVGVNKEIITDGVNGFLADSADEWFDRLSRLIEDEDLRKRLGMEGRKTVEIKYSIKANTPKLINVLTGK